MALVLLCVSLLQALRQEVKKLEMKFSGLNSAFDDQQQRLKELSSEVMYFSISPFLHSICFVPSGLVSGYDPKSELV